mmetsp:Transcript_90722/g.211061  ORF Transcript_90722/g.211061 Transcript_90722/m.211061 type:complete len:319 (-) Transcript_90722:514-1470(-)
METFVVCEDVELGVVDPVELAHYRGPPVPPVQQECDNGRHDQHEPRKHHLRGSLRIGAAAGRRGCRGCRRRRHAPAPRQAVPSSSPGGFRQAAGVLDCSLPMGPLLQAAASEARMQVCLRTCCPSTAMLCCTTRIAGMLGAGIIVLFQLNHLLFGEEQHCSPRGPLSRASQTQWPGEPRGPGHWLHSLIGWLMTGLWSPKECPHMPRMSLSHRATVRKDDLALHPKHKRRIQCARNTKHSITAVSTLEKQFGVRQQSTACGRQVEPQHCVVLRCHSKDLCSGDYVSRISNRKRRDRVGALGVRVLQQHVDGALLDVHG